MFVDEQHRLVHEERQKAQYRKHGFGQGLQVGDYVFAGSFRLRVTDLLTALALAVTIEGLAYAMFPDAMKRMMVSVLEQPSSNLRAAGLLAASLGVFAVWMVNACSRWRSSARWRAACSAMFGVSARRIKIWLLSRLKA